MPWCGFLAGDYEVQKVVVGAIVNMNQERRFEVDQISGEEVIRVNYSTIAVVNFSVDEHRNASRRAIEATIGHSVELASHFGETCHGRIESLLGFRKQNPHVVEMPV